ncbi:MAG: hypothetical protein MUC59_12720, partial [Saprospiraceae bacterium]|nr:hypothetical protein [Saprospiraceae bacterium]
MPRSSFFRPYFFQNKTTLGPTPPDRSTHFPDINAGMDKRPAKGVRDGAREAPTVAVVGEIVTDNAA